MKFAADSQQRNKGWEMTKKYKLETTVIRGASGAGTGEHNTSMTRVILRNEAKKEEMKYICPKRGTCPESGNCNHAKAHGKNDYCDFPFHKHRKLIYLQRCPKCVRKSKQKK